MSPFLPSRSNRLLKILSCCSPKGLFVVHTSNVCANSPKGLIIGQLREAQPNLAEGLISFYYNLITRDNYTLKNAQIHWDISAQVKSSIIS